MTHTKPAGYAAVTPSLIPDRCAEAIETYGRVFGAKENPQDRLLCPETGKILHTVIEIDGSKLMLSDPAPGCPMTGGANFYVYVDDCDAVMERASGEGMEFLMPATNMFWGDRMGVVKDRHGNQWSIATHVKDISRDELEEGAKTYVEGMKSGASGV